MKLLLVEDDFLIGDGLKKSLTKEGFSVDWVRSKEDANTAVSSNACDLIVLDVRLPDGSGLDFLANFRKTGNKTPVLLLTALNAIQDRVKGLDLGADDYLAKPFELTELCARIRALHRRTQGIAQSTLTRHEITLDPAAHTISQKGTRVDLGSREFSILQMMFERAGKVVTKSELEEKLYAWGEEVSSNAVEVLVHRIRKKLGNDVIKTIRGVGYLTEANDESF
jgi:two-component system response regulator QseB